MRHSESVSLTAELLRAGADPLLRDRDDKAPAEALSASGLRTELTRALAAAGRPIPSAPATLADLIGVIKRLGSVRGATAAEDDPAPVLALLEGDALLVNEVDSQGRTALFEAAFQGLPRVVETLLGRGARVDARDAGWGHSSASRARQRDHCRARAAGREPGRARSPAGPHPCTCERRPRAPWLRSAHWSRPVRILASKTEANTRHSIGHRRAAARTWWSTSSASAEPERALGRVGVY